MNKLFTNLRGDLFGGITAGIVALPLALAFGVGSGLGPAAGLYGAIFIAFFAALFGGTNTQISGPTAPMTALSTVIIAGLIAKFDGQVHEALPTILSVFLIAGIIQILFGVFKFGTYIKYIPYPVVSGFMTAIGIMILLGQLFPFLGYNPKADNEFVNKFRPQAEEILLDKILKKEADEGFLVLEDYQETIKRGKQVTQDEINTEAQTLAGAYAKQAINKFKVLPRALSNINWVTIGLALATIFIIYGFKKITTAIPSTLVALVAVTLGAILLQNLVEGFTYKPISEIPKGLPQIQLNITKLQFGSLTPYLGSAVMLALLGAIDSLLTSVVADNMTKTRHKSNQELIGQGIGNSIASIFGGIPGAGATIRTVVNINAGGKTKLSGMIAGILLFIILLALGPYVSKVPAAVLAGILITVGIGVMDYKGLKAIPKMPRTEVIIMLTVLILSVFWNLIYAVGIGLVMSALVFMKKMADMSAKKSNVRSIIEEESWDDEAELSDSYKEEVFIKHIDGPLFFGSTSDFSQLAGQIPATASDVIIRMDKVPYIDQSGLYALEDVLIDLNQKKINVSMVGLQEQPKTMLESIEIIPNLISKESLFQDFHQANVFVQNNVEDKY